MNVAHIMLFLRLPILRFYAQCSSCLSKCMLKEYFYCAWMYYKYAGFNDLLIELYNYYL